MTTKLENVIIPTIDASARWDIGITSGKVVSRVLSSSTTTSSHPSLLLPPLCHPHIHLDKPYILNCNHAPSASHPDYSDLAPKSGSFEEALANTSAAKARYTPEDLYLRGSQLVADSYRHGVTSMRAFVEVDHVTKFKTVEAGIRLKQDFEHIVRVQLCVFAQDPLFSGEHGHENRELLLQALDRYSGTIEALGTTPYVEDGRHATADNIRFAVKTAAERGLLLDFHLDYNLSPDGSRSSLREVCGGLARHSWDPDKPVAIGHCTHLTTLPNDELSTIHEFVASCGYAIHFVGLPTSDLFMMGRPAPFDRRGRDASHSRARGTLQVLSMIEDFEGYGFDACLGVNNVGNAFTPYGTGDPLQLACFGVGIYQAGTPRDAELLYECVSMRAREAMGLDPKTPRNRFSWCASPEDPGDRVPLPGLLIRNRQSVVLPAGSSKDDQCVVPARQRLSIKDVVWDPPDDELRSILS